YFFRGLRLDDDHLLLAGAVPSAAMALLADFGFSVFEKQFDTTAKRSRLSMRSLGIVLAVVTLVVIGFASWQAIGNRSHASSARWHVTVGSKDLSESFLLAEIVAQILEAQNVVVD